MSDLSRQRLFLRVMVWVALLALADGILEFCLSGAVHELALAIVMFLLLATMRWGLGRLARRADMPFIPPQSESA